jgi:3-methyladenine DNA glycosylase AlkD
VSLRCAPVGRLVTTPAELASEIERRLAGLGTAERAAAEKAYLKSGLEFFGVPVPGIRHVVRDLLPRPGRRDREQHGREYVVATAEALWRPPVHECRMAAVMVLADHAGVLDARDAPFVERLIRESGTWALVDVLAAAVAGSLVERFSELGGTLDAWSRDGDFWIRRAALLALLGPLRAGDGDFARFSRYADAMLEEKEFFIRKAIGWVLRDTARRRPGLVVDWLEPRLSRASGVTVREAVKPLPPETAARLLAGYRASRTRVR